MSVQLMKLRGVPEDELSELHALLQEEGIDYYETSAGNWGVSLPALWLRDESQLAHAQQVLNRYHSDRQDQAREEYQSLKQAGKARGWNDIVRENPLQFILYLLIIAVLVIISTAPFFGFDLGLGGEGA